MWHKIASCGESYWVHDRIHFSGQHVEYTPEQLTADPGDGFTPPADTMVMCATCMHSLYHTSNEGHKSLQHWNEQGRDPVRCKLLPINSGVCTEIKAPAMTPGQFFQAYDSLGFRMLRQEGRKSRNHEDPETRKRLQQEFDDELLILLELQRPRIGAQIVFEKHDVKERMQEIYIAQLTLQRARAIDSRSPGGGVIFLDKHGRQLDMSVVEHHMRPMTAIESVFADTFRARRDAVRRYGPGGGLLRKGSLVPLDPLSRSVTANCFSSGTERV